MDTSDLIYKDDISTKLISAKKSIYEFCTVSPTQREKLEQDGWEYIPAKLKKSIRLRKPKSHNDAFEDRVWALFARMGFHYLNKNNRFKLEYKPGLTKKLDVFAADEEGIIIVECKSSATRQKVTYQKDINEFISMKDGLRESAKNLFEGKAKVAFIFATHNSILSDTDRTRLETDSIFHFSDSNIDYYEQLVDHLGPAARYQLFGKLFANQNIPNLPNRVPAIQGKMCSGCKFYCFCIEPEFLLKMGFILHRTDTDLEASNAYQRLVKKPRLIDIGKYIDNGGYFPNAIIVNIQTKHQKDIEFKPAQTIENDAETKFGVLHLPKVYRSVFIIDGQHRLYGYSRAKSKSHQTIPVVAFENLPEAEQAKIFVDINHKQQSVPTNLLRSIMADFNWNSADAGLAISALKTRLLGELNNDDNSPLYHRFVLAEEKKDTKRCLTHETILRSGLNNRTNFFGKVKGKSLVKSGYLTEVNNEETLKKASVFFKSCFESIEDSLKDQWDAGSDDNGFIAMNNGVSATIRAIDHILDYQIKFKKLSPEKLSGKDLAENVKPYLIPVVDFVKALDNEGLKKLRSYYGGGATEKVLMEFLNAINKEFDDFAPEGLEQWKKEHSGIYNKASYELGHDHIEPMIHEYIVKQLKQELGEKSWWSEGVPKEIQKSCSDARIDAGTGEPDWHFLNTIHYETIIKKNWKLLGDQFTPPGMENIKAEKRLSWLNKLNAIRQRYSHPQRDIITENEYNFLKETYDWLKTKLV